MQTSFFSLLYFLQFFSFSNSKSVEKSECRDGIDNVITVDSYGDDLPVHVRNIKILVYDIFYNPSCYDGKVNVVLPGYFHILGGEVTVPRNYDLFHHAFVRASVDFGEMNVCNHGKSGMFIVPSRLCRFHITHFVPSDICRLLQQKGKHTLRELEEKLNFNSTLELPPSPSFLGIKLLDVLKGNYRILVELEVDGETIVRIAMPSNHIPVQLGL